MAATVTAAMTVTWEFSAGNAGRHRHRDREHVVDHQRAGHGHADARAEVGGGDLVVAAAGGVRVHVLPVGRDDHEHEQPDRERDPRRVGDVGQPAGRENEQDFLRRVSDR
jgi:hypothetical protein